MSRVAVTGAAGFLGRHVVPLLLEEGHDVRALVRPGSAAGALGNDVPIARGDVRNADAMRSFLADAEVVIHLASSFAPQEAVGVAEAGTQTVAAAAKESSVGRLVFTSCLAAHAAAASPFYRAKWKAEQLVRGSGVPYVILRPSLLVGPGDSVTRPLADIIRSLPVIPLPRDDGHRQQPVDVEDLARCVQKSAGEDVALNREVSVVGPMFLTLSQLVDLIQGQLGLCKAKLFLPRGLVPALAGFLPATTRNLFTGPRLAGFDRTNYASPGIVQREFGFEARSIVSRLGQYL